MTDSEAENISSTPQEPVAVSSLVGKKIMWVEDDQFLSDIISRKLSRENCELVRANEGEEAIEMAENEKPDIIILDVLLPGMDGYEVLARLKENFKTKDIPVILLSNIGQGVSPDPAKLAGSACFLVKASVTLDEIIEEVKVVLFRQAPDVAPAPEVTPNPEATI